MAARNYLPLAFTFILLGCFAASQAGEARIKAEQSIYNEGEEISITCYLDAALDPVASETLFFFKRQTTVDGNATDTISAGNFILDAYKDRDFTVFAKPDTVPAASQYALTIKNARHEDTGEYGCVTAVATDKDFSQRISWTTLAVKRDVQEVSVYAIDENSTRIELTDGETYRLTKKQNYKLECIAKGSIPQATLDFYLGAQRVTDQLFYTSHVATKTKDNVGARDVITYDSIVSSQDTFIVNAPQNISCQATIHGKGGKTFSFMTEFPHAPTMKCEKTYAGYLQRGVKLSCEVSADPDLTDVYWNITLPNNKIYIIREGDSDFENRYTFEKKKMGDQMKYALTLTIVDGLQKQHFAQEYSASAVNEEGKVHQPAHLIHERQKQSDPNIGANIDNGVSGLYPSILLLLTLKAFWVFLRR